MFWTIKTVTYAMVSDARINLRHFSVPIQLVSSIFARLAGLSITQALVVIITSLWLKKALIDRALFHTDGAENYFKQFLNSFLLLLLLVLLNGKKKFSDKNSYLFYYLEKRIFFLNARY